MARTVVGAMAEIRADFQLVPTPPLFQRQLVDRQKLELIGSPHPGIEEVAAPPFGSDQHVFRSLAVRVAVKPRVAKRRTQQRAGMELVAIGGPDGDAPLP